MRQRPVFISFCFCTVALSTILPFNEHITDVQCVMQLIVPRHSVLLSLQSKRHRFNSELSNVAVVLRTRLFSLLAPTLCQSLEQRPFFFKSIKLVTTPCLYKKEKYFSLIRILWPFADCDHKKQNQSMSLWNNFHFIQLFFQFPF